MSKKQSSSKLPPRLTDEDVDDLLARVDNAAAEARAELYHAKPIVHDAGLSVHSSVLDPAFNRPPAPVPGTSLATTDDFIETSLPSTDANNSTFLDNSDQKEAALACLHARQTYNPLRGTLSAFPFVLSTTGGYSNTDHIIKYNPADGTVDKLSEYKRKLKRRARQSQLDEQSIVNSITTHNATYKWDLPRIPGGRRRRIKRDTDAPSAPPRPPEQGYLIFVSQMTTKLRHDNPNRHHDQISAVRRIAPMWHGMSEEDRNHYNDLARDAREEYLEMLREFRSTGGYKSFKCIEKVKNKPGFEHLAYMEDHRNSLGPWVRIPYERKNALEKEIATYDVVCFPPRPPEMNEAYEQRMKESRERRRKKIREEGLRYY